VAPTNCSVLKVNVVGLLAYGGFVRLKLPKDSRVGDDVAVVRTRLLNRIWLVGCPLTRLGVAPTWL
jgi:hypothetical protein